MPSYSSVGFHFMGVAPLSKVTLWIVVVRKRVFGSPDNFLTPVAHGMDNKTKVHGEHSRERGAEPASLSGFGSVNSFLSCSII
jgi:hypothetical protein